MADLPTACVIGAGVSGLVAGKALGDWGIDYECFEASDDVGGNWYFGNPNRRSSAYRSLHIDISKDSISFRDFPMPERYPDYPHHTHILEWLRDYADAFALRDRIRFETSVESAERLEGGGWRVALDSGEVRGFDALVVANGHHWDPRFPDFRGRFDGETIHSHDYGDVHEPLDTHGRRVMVVGIGNSAVDIASEVSRKGVAELTYVSTRSFRWGCSGGSGASSRASHRGGWRTSACPRPTTASWRHTRRSRASSCCGSARATRWRSPMWPSSRGTACASPTARSRRWTPSSTPTGYKISFPFFDPDFLSAPDNRLPLYKRVFKPGVDDLAFIGLGQPIPTIFRFSELQSKLVARYLGGDWALPDKVEMQRTIERDQKVHAGRFADRPRHTMQLDWHRYEHDLVKRTIPEGRERARTGGAPRLAERAARLEPAEGAARPEPAGGAARREPARAD